MKLFNIITRLSFSRIVLCPFSADVEALALFLTWLEIFMSQILFFFPFLMHSVDFRKLFTHPFKPYPSEKISSTDDIAVFLLMNQLKGVWVVHA